MRLSPPPTVALMLLAALSPACKQDDENQASDSGGGGLISGRSVESANHTTRWFGPKTITVADGVHVLGELAPSAVYAIEYSEGVVLIDAGGEESCHQLIESLRELSIEPESIRYVLLTHAHFDHVLGARRLRELTGATICAGAADAEAIRWANARRVTSPALQECRRGL